MSPALWLLRDEDPAPSSRPSAPSRRRREHDDDGAHRARVGTATFVELLARAYSEDE